MRSYPLLIGKLIDVLKAVTPLVGLILLLQFTVVQAPAEELVQFLAGSVLIVVGMILLFIGVDLGILPMGRFIGAEIPKKGSVAVITVTFVLAFATTVAEPDVLVLAGQIDIASGGTLSGHAILLFIGFGVAGFAAIAIGRIIFGMSMRLMLTAAFGLIILLSFIAPAEIIALAFDAGSVTTGVLSAPVVIALAMGLSSVLAGRSAVSDGFGLLGFASIGPVLVLLLAGIMRP